MTNKQQTFQPIIVHAANEHCSRDILVSPHITLNQLNKYLLYAFDINEHQVEHYQFSQKDENLNIETCFGLIGDQQQELDGFLTPIAPGVYIEHSHPHEPLASFSIFKNNLRLQDANMSFRLLRDERHVRLQSCCNNTLFYEFQYMQLHYNIQLQSKIITLPTQFTDTITTDPKIIHKRGHLITKSRMMNISSVIQANLVSPRRDGNFHNSFDEIDEQSIRETCRNEIERLKDERKLFLLNQQRKKCNWLEPSGDHCVYCTLL